MRLIDFFVFYISTLYTNKRRGNLFWDSPIRRTVSIVGLTILMWLLSISQIVVFLIANKNLTDFSLFIGGLVLGGLLVIQFLRYIYVVRKRYEFITSSKYKSFTLSTTLGVTICSIIVLVSILIPIGVGIAIYTLMKNHIV